MVPVAPDADALAATAAGAPRAAVAACAAVIPAAFKIDAFAAAVGRGAYAAEFHVPNAIGIPTDPAEIASYSASAAVASVAL
jgi:hypothetical protein